MADETTSPPIISNDDHEDLFVSAIETNSKPENVVNSVSVEPSIDDLMISHEIDLEDDDNIENVDQFREYNDFNATHNSVTNDYNDKVLAMPSKSILSQSTTSGDSALNQTTNSNTSSGDITTKNSVNDQFIEVSVGEPQKVGDGMSAYVVYRVTTKTNLPYFRKNSFSVNRRFSDFLGLRDKLSEKHVHVGRIVPPAPEKSAVGMAKVKMSKDESVSSAEFIEKRRASLERYLNRNASHPILCTDPDFREFLELDTDLPKATNTSALSGAGVKRLLSRVGDTVNKMTFRMDESDPWFEEKQNQIENLDQQMRKLHASVEALIYYRKELTQTTGAFAKSAAMLGNCEEHTSLSCALSQLAETEEKIEHLYSEQVDNDFLYLSELLKDYVSLIGSVKDVFHQRVKVFQTWQHAQQTLTKKRELKAKLELAAKTDKVGAANDEVIEWEAKVGRGQEEFENVSKMIKQEVERFEISRIRDFKSNFIKYMESLLETQQQLIKYWETFLPEAKAIV